MPRPIVALLTDFGTRDHYAGTMKGVILGVCPEATLVDITHEIPPHDVQAAAFELAAAYKYFPPGTIFLVVVDPGVGSERRALAARAGEYLFVAPDNGVLTAVFREAPPQAVVELSEPRYARSSISRTFEGRDRFAPAAAWLATRIAVTEIGRPLSSWQMLDLAEPTVTDGRLTGEVVRVDRFGNLITNVDRARFDAFRREAPVDIRVGGQAIDRLVSTYAEAPPGTACALFGSTGHLEIAINGASAADVLRLSRGAAVRIDRR